MKKSNARRINVHSLETIVRLNDQAANRELGRSSREEHARARVASLTYELKAKHGKKATRKDHLTLALFLVASIVIVTVSLIVRQSL